MSGLGEAGRESFTSPVRPRGLAGRTDEREGTVAAVEEIFGGKTAQVAVVAPDEYATLGRTPFLLRRIDKYGGTFEGGEPGDEFGMGREGYDT